ncbi:hypothetical protein [Azohydromonas caseinilytica]|uniref:Uncharacterized protein n=1 Tax=Azohydromonas caseinilytica TaxID=2728836 RepID=A0A848FGG6_9BURK|nr:hypothetical protein [Azohydromonas caseinilytica]NML17945.1 hypothetical protein [Azohydromonas caseinilytica]
MSHSPVKMMLDVAFGRHQTGTRAGAPDTVVLHGVAEAAVAWWMAHRPSDWSLEQHLADPAVNCKSDQERQLAYSVAQWLSTKK